MITNSLIFLKNSLYRKIRYQFIKTNKTNIKITVLIEVEKLTSLKTPS